MYMQNHLQYFDYLYDNVLQEIILLCVWLKNKVALLILRCCCSVSTLTQTEIQANTSVCADIMNELAQVWKIRFSKIHCHPVKFAFPHIPLLSLYEKFQKHIKLITCGIEVIFSNEEFLVRISSMNLQLSGQIQMGVVVWSKLNQ